MTLESHYVPNYYDYYRVVLYVNGIKKMTYARNLPMVTSRKVIIRKDLLPASARHACK